MTKIVIADDHQIVIDGIRSLLEQEIDLEIAGQALTGKELLETGLLCEPDLILMDIGMPVMDGITASKEIRKTHPEMRILVLTTYADAKHIREMMKVGVNGYLLKDSGKDQFLEAIHTVMNGEKYFDQQVTEVIMNSLQPPKKHSTILTPLSPREKEIVRLIAKGDSTMEMAEKLHLSQLTIETHRKNIYTKLGMNKIASLVHYAINEGLFEEE